MDPRGKNTPLIIVTILVCLVGLGVLNYVQTKANPTEDERQAQAQEQQDAAQKAAKIAAAKAASAPTAPTKSSIGTGSNGALPSELVIGNPATAKIKVTVGYTYDDATAQKADDARAVIQAAQDWARKHPADSLQVVCVDLPADQVTNPSDASVPLGISISGNQPPGMGDNPGEGKDIAANVQALLGPIP